MKYQSRIICKESIIRIILRFDIPMLKVQGYNILPFPFVSQYLQKVGREFQLLYIFELYLNKLNIQGASFVLGQINQLSSGLR